MFAVIPQKTCPHICLLRPDEAPECKPLRMVVKVFFINIPMLLAIDHTKECVDCNTAIENWVCLLCFQVYCSRYINEHSSMHSVTADHPLALSLTDLSVWCHKCSFYVDNPQLHKFKNLVHRSKFGEELVWSYGNLQIDLSVESDSE